MQGISRRLARHAGYLAQASSSCLLTGAKLYLRVVFIRFGRGIFSSFRCDCRFSGLLLYFLSCIPSNIATLTGNLFAFFKSLWVAPSGYFCGRYFRKHVQHKFKVSTYYRGDFLFSALLKFLYSLVVIPDHACARFRLSVLRVFLALFHS